MEMEVVRDKLNTKAQQVPGFLRIHLLMAGEVSYQVELHCSVNFYFWLSAWPWMTEPYRRAKLLFFMYKFT